MVLTVKLLGRMELWRGRDRVLLEGRRVQELLAFLLLHRGQPVPREVLADVIMGEGEPEQARKGLRQALWKLQSGTELPDGPVLSADGDFVAVELGGRLNVDVAEFEAALLAASGLRGAEMGDALAERLRVAADLYRGDYLDGWYLDWSLLERERLIGLHLAMLNKLSAWCAAHGRYAEGMAYGYRALEHDPAHERSHRHLMRLHYLDGDRCAAIRQYQHCVAALRDELGVGPDTRTQELLRRISDDSLGPAASEFCDPASENTPPSLRERLKAEVVGLRAALAAVEQRIALL